LQNRSWLTKIVDSICLSTGYTRSFFSEYKYACNDLNTSKKRQFEFLENYSEIIENNAYAKPGNLWPSVKIYKLYMDSYQKKTDVKVKESKLIDGLNKSGKKINEVLKQFSSEDRITGKNGNTINENNFYTSWKKNDSEINKAYEKKTSLREELRDKVYNYIGNTKKSLAKKNVMIALSGFLRDPSPANLKYLKETTEKNKGWDSGFFSEVRKTHDQIVNMHIKSGLK